MVTQENTVRPGISDTGIDLSDLLARVEYDRDLLRELYQIFLEEFPPLRLELRHSMSSGNLKNVQVAAHTLKGMLASLSFSQASASALLIERMAAQDLPGAIPEELARLEYSAALAAASLGDVCREAAR